MRKLNILLLLLGVFSFQMGRAQLDSVIWEVYYQDDGSIPGYPTGFTTYRIYALLEDTTYRVVSLYSNPQSTSDFIIGSSNNRIWNNMQSSAVTQLLGDLDTLSLESMDSYLTVGKTLEGAENYLPNGVHSAPTQIIMSSFAHGLESSDSIQMNLRCNRFRSDPQYDGLGQQTNSNENSLMVFPSNENSNGDPQGPDRRVLLAQITTDGEPMYSIGIRIKSTQGYYDYHYEPVVYQIDGSDLGLCYPPGSCGQYFGCADVGACNYDPDAMMDINMCLYGTDCTGCTHYGAVNYKPEANFDDGTCLYHLRAIFFNDYNANGIWEGGEPVLDPFYVQALMTDTGDTAVYNQNVSFNNDVLDFDSIPQGVHNIEFSAPDYSDFYFTNGTNVEIDIPSAADVFSNVQIKYRSLNGFVQEGWNIGYLSAVFGINMSGTFYQVVSNVSANNFLCNSEVDKTYTLFNQSNQMVRANTELIVDTLYQGIIEAVGADSIVGNHIYYSSPMLETGQFYNQPFRLLSPLADYAGQVAKIEINTQVYNIYDSLVLSLNSNRYEIIQCSFDPNSISVLPEGYTENHFVLAGDTLQYIINFQNTGNFPAQNVILIDSLDWSKFDINSIEILASSHDYYEIVNEDGAVQFVFENIQLADSTSNEEESHGYITFKLATLASLQEGEQISNTGYIQFDNNDLIVTNTVFHTIFECSSLTTAFSGLDSIDGWCFGDEQMFDVGQNFVETYEWMVDGESYSTSNTVVFNDMEEGIHTVQLILSNPLCTALFDYDFEVYHAPDDSVFVFAMQLYSVETENSLYDWYWSGSIEGDPLLYIDSNHVPLSTEIFMVWNVDLIIESIYGCSTSVNFYTISVAENEFAPDFSMSPNPLSDQTILRFPQGGVYQVKITDMPGHLVESWTKVQNNLVIDRGRLSKGIYSVSVEDEGHRVVTKLLVVE